MKSLFLILTLSLVYFQTPHIKVTEVYQRNVIDLLDPSRPRLA